MAFRPPHEMHTRRFSRNMGVLVVLLAFVALVFALTVVKVTNGDLMHANDTPGALGSTQPLKVGP
jgi:predicted PurR-regulated permease PerM